MMSEQLPNQLQSPEESLAEETSSFEIYKKTIEEKDSAGFKEAADYIRQQIMTLQREDRLPSALMSDKDRDELIMAFCLAVDRRFIVDSEEARKDWICLAVQRIYDSNKK